MIARKWKGAAIAAMICASSCTRPVEPGIFVVVRSNIAGLSRVRVQLSRDGRPGAGGTLYLDTIFPVRRAAPDVVGSLAVRAPTDRPDTQLYVSATALVGDREAVTQRALVSFDPRGQQRLTMFLAAECEGFDACSPQQTCTVGPRCVSEAQPALPSARQDGGADPLVSQSDASALDASDGTDVTEAMDASDADRAPAAMDAMDAMDAAADAAMDVASERDASDASDDGTSESGPDAAQDVYLSDAADVLAEEPPPRSYPNAVVVGGTHVCARFANVPYCWGSRSHGQVGDGVIANDTVGPTRFTRNLHTFALGARHTCALDSSTVYCWGDANNDALGRAGASATATPTLHSPPIFNATTVSAGGTSSCAGLSGEAYLYSCWGDNRFGQLGIIPVGTVATPTRAFTASPAPLSLPPFMGSETHCIRMGRPPWLACVGRNDRSQFGAASPLESSTLTAVPTISAYANNGGTGGAHACILTSPGAITCWGDNTELQCGRGAYSGAMMDVPPPPQAPALIDDPRRDWQVVEAGRAVTCAIDGLDELYCWGSNEQGQLGTGSMVPRRSAAPLRVRLPDRVSFVNASADGDVVCAITRSLAVYCWGDNRWGQLGYAPRAIGVAEPTPMPVMIGL